MKKKIEEWMKLINDQDIPILRSTVKSISHLSSDDDTSTSELSRIVLSDAFLTARVLKLVNSPFYNRFKTSINTISRALVMLGFNVVRDMCLSLIIIDGFLKKEFREHVKKIMAKSFHAAVQARAISEFRGIGSPEEIFVATLLYRFGEMAFWCVAKKEADQLLELEKRPGYTPEQAQQEVLGFTFDELTAALATHWNLSKVLEDAFDAAKQHLPATKLVSMGQEIADIVPTGWNTNELKELTQDISEEIGAATASVRKMIRSNAETAVELANNFGIKEVANVIPDVKTKKKDEEAEPVVIPYPEPNPLLQLKILRELSVIMESQPDLNLILEASLEGIYRGVGLDRTLFALIPSLKQQVRAKYVLGLTNEYLLKNFAFPAERDTNNPFAIALYEEKSLWIKNTRISPYDPSVMQQIRETLGVESFFIAPIVVKNKPIGLFYGDRQPSKRSLDEESFNGFKHFGQQACLAIAYITKGR